MKISRGLRVTTALVVASTQVACGRLDEREYEVENPNHTASVVLVIHPGWMLKPNLQIDLKEGNKVTRLYENPRSEVIIPFAEIAWSPDSRLVGILVRNPYGESVSMAYDVQQRKRVDMALVKDLLREQIRKNYDLHADQNEIGKDSDPLRWMYSQEAQDAYFKRVKSKK